MMFSRLLGSLHIACCLLLVPLASRAESVVTTGDQLQINVFGREDLSGKFRVHGGRLSVPLVGQIHVEGTPLATLEETLAKHFETKTGVLMSVNVEFFQRAPFYIAGEVKAPGAYPYRDGLTVLQAVALGGGVERALASSERVDVEILRELGKRDIANKSLASRLLTKARLLAERNGEDSVVAPDQVDRLVSADRKAELLADELSDLQSRNSLYQSAVEEHRKRIEIGQEEVSAYERQIVALEQQRKLITSELDRAQNLKERGVGMHSRVFDMQQRLSALASDSMNAVASLARAKTQISTAKAALDKEAHDRAIRISKELRTVDRESAELEAAAENSQRVILGLQVLSGAIAPKATYYLIRKDGGEQNRITVDESALVRPGDVVHVTLPPRADEIEFLEGQRVRPRTKKPEDVSH